MSSFYNLALAVRFAPWCDDISTPPAKNGSDGLSFGSVYLLIFPNGKGYVGVAGLNGNKSASERYAEHARKAAANAPQALYCAWRKYGAPQLLVVATEVPSNVLFQCEIDLIAFLKTHVSFGCGYNMTFGGDGLAGWKPNQEQIAAHAKSMQKRKDYTVFKRERRLEYFKSLKKPLARCTTKKYRSPMPREQYLTALEAAEYLQVHYRTLRRLLGSGQIKGSRLPGVGGRKAKCWRVPLSALHEYIEQGDNK